jgi:protein-S-isoprenylcysteine O-methyltransferase Ste14
MNSMKSLTADAVQGIDSSGPAFWGPARTARTARTALRVASTFFAMTGWRLEHLNVVWVAAGAGSIALAHHLVSLGDWRLTVPYFLFTLLFYYGGNGAILSSRAPALLIARLGEQRAFRAYETVLGVMFLNQGLGVGCMAALPGWRLAAPRGALVAGALVLFCVGLGVKLWATFVVGTDTFYYFDMFVRRAVGTASHEGPYRFLENPMYGVGNLQGYGYALFVGSLVGLLAAAAGHVLIFAFYLLFERDFVRRTYPAVSPSPGSVPPRNRKAPVAARRPGPGAAEGRRFRPSGSLRGR